MREWLSSHLDDLAANIFIATAVAALVGFIRRSTGAAVFVSCSCACMVVLIVYPWVSDLGYSWKVVIATLGPAAGVLALGLFKLAITISDKLDARNAEIADRIIKKAEGFLPGGGDK